MKCNALSYRIDTTDRQIVASLSFADFDQSMRFMKLLTDFILVERKQPHILEDIAWYCPPAIASPTPEQTK